MNKIRVYPRQIIIVGDSHECAPFVFVRGDEYLASPSSYFIFFNIRRRSSNAGSRDMQGGGSGSILYLGSDSGSSSEFFYNNAVNSNRFNGGGGAGITDIPEDQTVGMSSSSTLTKSKSFRKKQELLNPSRSSSVSLLQAGTLSTGTDSNGKRFFVFVYRVFFFFNVFFLNRVFFIPGRYRPGRNLFCLVVRLR